LKLSVLFAKYLYQNKSLNLPGIGSFEIDSSIPIPEASEKNYSEFLKNVRFTEKTITKPEEGFIDFIRTHTGKIKPLAESDLDSYLSDGILLLNIGKPFFLEGIGTLQKTRAGRYEFTPGAPLFERLDSYIDEKGEEKAYKKKSVFDSEYSQMEPESNAVRKLLIAGGIIIGIAVVIGGGFLLYNKTNDTPTTLKTDSITIAKDSINAARADSIIRDSARKATNPPISNEGYRFVIETTNNKDRALKRYRQLRDLNIPINLETNDSSFFKLYFLLPSNSSDTSRIKDSLERMFNSKRVIVEELN
jgi:hypothetical protein